MNKDTADCGPPNKANMGWRDTHSKHTCTHTDLFMRSNLLFACEVKPHLQCVALTRGFDKCTPVQCKPLVCHLGRVGSQFDIG